MPASSSSATTDSTSSRAFETFVEQRPAELQRREPEALARLDRALPFAATELVREDAEPRPLRPREPRQHGSCEGEVARHELAGARRRLEHDPVVVADLVERPRALGEVDRPEARRAVADGHANVLEMDAPDERPERTNLGRGVHPARDDVGEVEVAAERSGCDAAGERPDRFGGQRALVTEHDVCVGGGSAQHAESVRRPVEVGLVVQLAASEERDEDRARSELGRPRDRALDVATRGLGHGRIGVGDTAAVAELAEHQARHGEPGRGLLAHERREPIARTELLAPDVELHTVEREPPRRLEHSAARRGLEDRVHDADLHRSARPTRRRRRAAIPLRPSGTRRA